MLIHWIWFAQLSGLNPAQKLELLQHFHDPEEIFHSNSVDDDNKNLTQAQNILAECKDKGIGLLTYGDEAYPKRLRNLYDAPLVLYFKGVLPDWDSQPVIGIVGTRSATPYGLNTAEQFGRQIAACGGLVVSGGAKGIDAMAMQGALAAGKPTVGVLGCGVDIVYPAENRFLFERVCKAGCLLSEYPPRTRPASWNFPKRNRIISGLSNGLLVVEAPEKSGALSSAHHAWEQGRDVFAVPGNIGVAACAGSNALLQDRALAALSGWDVVKEYQALYPQTVQKRQPPMPEHTTLETVAQTPVIPLVEGSDPPARDKKPIDNKDKSTYSVVNSELPALSETEQAVLALIPREPIAADAVIAQAQLPASVVRGALTFLALKQRIVNHPGGRVSLK